MSQFPESDQLLWEGLFGRADSFFLRQLLEMNGNLGERKSSTSFGNEMKRKIEAWEVRVKQKKKKGKKENNLFG